MLPFYFSTTQKWAQQPLNFLHPRLTWRAWTWPSRLELSAFSQALGLSKSPAFPTAHLEARILVEPAGALLAIPPEAALPNWEEFFLALAARF
jgi:hypothetical protein